MADKETVFDQQQQDLVDAPSRPLPYGHNVIEENTGLALEVAQQERSAFVSCLLPLLAEYQLQPQVPDAQSIANNVTILFRHLQEKLLSTESKLKELQYQLMPLNIDVNNSNISSPALYYSVGQGSTTSACSDANELERNPEIQESRRQVGRDAQGEVYELRYNDETNIGQFTFDVPVSHSETEGPDERRQNGSGRRILRRYRAIIDDPGSSNLPHRPPVLEKRSSSLFEDTGDDPLPAIEGLQISGEAFPGRELQASGYSINGTTVCTFQWVRQLEDGTVNMIDGAEGPNYLVTADDVDTYLAIEVQPLDARERKGELVKVFSNEQRKVTCDPEMQKYIENIFFGGNASFKISLLNELCDIWEPATLSIKRKSYSIECGGRSGTVVTRKFSSSTNVTICSKSRTKFVVADSGGAEHLLRADENPIDVGCLRDAIVLILRLFTMRAILRKKCKRKEFFVHKRIVHMAKIVECFLGCRLVDICE